MPSRVPARATLIGLLGGVALAVSSSSSRAVEFDLPPERTREAFEYGKRSVGTDRDRFLAEWTRRLEVPGLRGDVRIFSEYSMLAIAGRDVAERGVPGGPNLPEVLCELSTDRLLYFVVGLEASDREELRIRSARLRRADGREVRAARTRIDRPYRDARRPGTLVAHSSFMFPPAEVDLRGAVELLVERVGRPVLTVGFDLGSVR